MTLKFLPILFCLIPATVFAEKLPATGPCHDLGQATFDMCRTGFKTAKVDDKSTCQTAATIMRLMCEKRTLPPINDNTCESTADVLWAAFQVSCEHINPTKGTKRDTCLKVTNSTVIDFLMSCRETQTAKQSI